MSVFQKIINFVLIAVVIVPYGLAQDHYMVRRLPLNTGAKELAPTFYHHDLVFCSDKKREFLISRTDLDNNRFTNLYLAEQRKPGKFENPRLFSQDLTTLLWEGPASFSQDGNIIYFTRSIDITKSIRNRQREDTTFGIFTAEFRNGVWSNLSQFRFNSVKYQTGFPSLSDDGSLLFFCSDAPGGTGGFDIYVSKLENGRWGVPKNLGSQINTSGNEVFPFYHSSGRLYFSSRGQANSDDLDIFYTMEIQGEWQKPIRLSAPFNTRADDYGLVLNAQADTGYFVTTRDGSADIFSAYSSIPTFRNCPVQQQNDYCFVFYEPNNNEVDTLAFAYEWDLGDGTLIRALEAEHCYAKPDTYLVQLNIVDKLSGELVISQSSHEFVVEPIQQPFIQAAEQTNAGTAVPLNGRETFIKDFNVNKYYWDFGDGFRDEGLEVTHSFNFPGTYQLTLGVTNDRKNKDDPELRSCVSRTIVVAP